jgi:hypothetical protein
MDHEQRLIELQKQAISNANSMLNSTKSLATGLIFSDNGLNPDQKKQAHSTMTHLFSGKATKEDIEKATVFMNNLQKK